MPNFDREVSRVAAALEKAGVEPGDRVVGFMPNMPESIIAMLAAASLGATWSSCSPDFGIKGVLDRFGQIQPKVLFTADGYFSKASASTPWSASKKSAGPSPASKRIVVVPYTSQAPDISAFAKALHMTNSNSPAEDKEISLCPNAV
jgi:acetoacetyl-CoA synthetase